MSNEEFDETTHRFVFSDATVEAAYAAVYKRLRVSFDLDGVLWERPELFQPIVAALVAAGHEYGVIAGFHHTEERVAKVRIDHDDSYGPLTGCRVFLDDSEREVPGLVEARFVHHVRDPPRVELEVNALDGCDITVEADVRIAFNVYPGWGLHCEVLEDGRQRWTAVEESKL